MPRQRLIRNRNLPYHVTARANNRDKFCLPLNQVWKLICDECYKLQFIYEVEFHALVLMPNHIHILLSVPNYDLGLVMNIFMSAITKESNLKSGRSGHLFGGPYHRTLIETPLYFAHALKYVYRNPVKAKLCDRVEDYQFSSLHGLVGNSPLPIAIYYTRERMDFVLPSTEPNDQLEWLNQSFPEEADKLIQAGLRKSIFSTTPRNRSTRKPQLLLDALV